MYKIKHSSENISPFSGLNFIFSSIVAKSIPDFIDAKIGFRDFRAKYSHSDIILSLLGNSLTKGEFVSDIRFFKDNFDDHTNTEINRNAVLNSILPAICVKLGLLNSVEKYVLYRL